MLFLSGTGLGSIYQNDTPKLDQVAQHRDGSGHLLMSFVTSGSNDVNAVVKFAPFLSFDFTNNEQIKSPKLYLRLLQFCNCFPEHGLLSFL